MNEWMNEWVSEWMNEKSRMIRLYTYENPKGEYSRSGVAATRVTKTGKALQVHLNQSISRMKFHFCIAFQGDQS